jgi:hypothetical protein
MSPWNESRRRMWPVYVGIALIVLGFVSGYLLLTGVVGTPDGDDGSGDRSAHPSTPSVTEPDDDSPPPRMLHVVSWGRASGQLAVVVRNDSRRFIDRARVRITAHGAADSLVLTTTGTSRDVCCTIVGLPPGEVYGLFAEVDPDLRDITAVEVEQISVDTRPADSDWSVAVETPALLRFDDDTVVTARLTARGRLSGYVAAQAILTGPNGAVAQVISGRFYCFEPGRSRLIRLHLFHAVPADLELARIVAYPIPAGVPPAVSWECR